MACIGAIIGDIVGSIYEFNNHRSKDFPLFSDSSTFTDDSILTIATMQALINGGTYDNFVESYRLLVNNYPSSYGARFSEWLTSRNPQPYNSWGNGAPMRVSPIAWYYDNLKQVEDIAKVSAEVTHNHPEGVKGAQSVAGATFLARTGGSKKDIARYFEQYGYSLNFTLASIRDSYQFDESSAGTVPQAVVAFLESTGFEDAIRNAISIGGDSDTLAAITGSIAEAFYGVPNTVKYNARQILDKELLSILDEFSEIIEPQLATQRFYALSDDEVAMLRELNEAIQSHQSEWGTFHSPAPTTGGAMQLPWWENGELIDRFADFMYRNKLIVIFDWAKWQEGRDWPNREDEEKYNELDAMTALKLLTAVIRNDRFNDGALILAFKSGEFPKIINQLTYLLPDKRSKNSG